MENPPFQVRPIGATQCCLLQNGSLKSKLNSAVKDCQYGLAFKNHQFSADLQGLLNQLAEQLCRHNLPC